jgi:hypothetical protein
MDVIGMLWKEAQEGTIPQQGTVVMVKRAHGNVQPVQRRGNRLQEYMSLGHEHIVLLGELATHGRPRGQVVRKRTLGEQVKRDMARGIARGCQRTAGFA